MPEGVADLSDALARLEPGVHDFVEVLRAPNGSLSVTIARWPAGSVDEQTPHGEDEVYHVTAGRGVLVVAGERLPVQAGSVAFVAAGVEHRFVEIAEDLEVVVFWSPARHTNPMR
jgi:mannose-6-phosphate isomerase-like protein (cupin superfamily)